MPSARIMVEAFRTSFGAKNVADGSL